MNNLSISYLRGNQNKWQEGNRFYKADLMGYESISEVLVDELCLCTPDINCLHYYLEYKIRNTNPVYCCYSENFLAKEEQEYTLLDILKSVGKESYLDNLEGDALLYFLLEEIKRVTNYSEFEILEYIGKILYLDSIILNEDRHLNNISFIRNGNSWRFAPVFDNGLSLLSDVSKYLMYDKHLGAMINGVRSKPFSDSFRVQLSYLKDIIPPIKLDIALFKKRMFYIQQEELFQFAVPFKQDCFKRALKVLYKRLNELEGIAWNQYPLIM